MNQVHLIAVIACRPMPVGERGDIGFVVLTFRDPEGRRVDRHRVVLEAGRHAEVENLAPGDTAYVEGRLSRYRDGRSVVIARQAWVVERFVAPSRSSHGSGTHASPAPHARRGHHRRVHTGTPDEGIVWVRPTWVGERSPAPGEAS
jgi:hypothetical protein